MAGLERLVLVRFTAIVVDNTALTTTAGLGIRNASMRPAIYRSFH
jgi:hypothetical protein